MYAQLISCSSNYLNKLKRLISGTHILKAFSIRVSNFCLLHCWWLVDSFSSQNCCTGVFLWTMGWRCLKTAAHRRSVVKDLSRKLLKFSVGHSTDGLLSLADRVMLLELSTGWLTSPFMQGGSLFHFAGSFLILIWATRCPQKLQYVLKNCQRFVNY